MLLHKATFSDASEVPVSSSIQSVIKSITSFDTRMQAWNIYLAVLLAHNPSCAVKLFGYQRLTCSANTLLPVHSWLQYDSTFHTLAAANPLLCWDQQHPDLWLECLTSGQQNEHWPCPYCRTTNHFPSNCPHSEHIPVQPVVCSIKDTAPVKTAPINTFAFPAKVSTPGPSPQEGGEIPPVSVNSKAPIQPLMLECEPSLPQMPPSMTSKSTLLYSEPSSPAYSQIFDSICDLPSTSSLPTFPPEHDYLLEPRSFLIEYESNPSLDVVSDEHSLTFDLAPSRQKTTFTAPPKHTASTIDQLPFNLQQFLLPISALSNNCYD